MKRPPKLEMIFETDDFVAGRKRSRDPEFVAPSPEVATVVLGAQTARKFFGVRTEGELRDHLRKLKAEGRLIHDRPDSLRIRVRVKHPRGQYGIVYQRGIVVRGCKRDVPLYERPRDPSKGKVIALNEPIRW